MGYFLLPAIDNFGKLLITNSITCGFFWSWIIKMALNR